MAAALLDAASGWVRERGRERMLGPMDFTTNDECGLLVEGYELRAADPAAVAPALLPRAGRGPGVREVDGPVDVVAQPRRADVHRRGLPPDDPRARRARSTDEHGVTIRDMSKRDLEAELGRFIEVYNSAWEKNWGFVPITEEEVRAQASDLKPVLDEAGASSPSATGRCWAPPSRSPTSTRCWRR